MKSPYLHRLIGASLVSGLVLALSPALRAQSASSYIASGIEQTKTGNYDAAIAEYTKALELNSSNLGAYVYRGQAKAAQGNFDGAAADFSQAIKLKPTFAEGYFSRAFAEFMQGNFEAAKADFTKTIELRPDTQAYFYRGLTLDCAGDFEGAVRDYAKAIQLKSGNDDPGSYVVLHQALEIRRLGHGGDDHLKSTREWSNEWTTALASFVNGQLSEAELLRMANSSDGDEKTHEQTEAYYYVGMVRLMGGKKAVARQDFQKAFDESGPAALVHRLARTELDRP